MGWRYRKRIKILPGIHLNISKSGISTNVGVKGANVTFGKKGTYVNTGIPGTGLYRRDKISRSEKKDKPVDTFTAEKKDKAYKPRTAPNSQNKQKGYDEKTSYLSFKPSHYIFFFWAFFFSLAPLSCFLNGVNMLYGCLANALLQLILSFAIINNMSANEKTTAYNIKLIEDATISAIKKDIKGHIVRCSLYIIIAIINLLPLFLMNNTFRRLLYGYDITYKGGLGVILLSLFVFVCWIVVFFSEKNMITPLKKIVALKDGRINTNDSKDETLTESATNKQPSSLQTKESGDGNRQETSKQDIETIDSTKRESSFTPQPQEDLSQPFDPYKELKDYNYPQLDLLRLYESDIASIDEKQIVADKNSLVKTLNNFGVIIREIRVTMSPKYSFYEVTLADGVHSSVMDGLEDDIAMALHSHHVQIISPIPGKGSIGILVPKTKPDIVSLRSVYDSKKFTEEKMDLPCAIGKTISNEVFIFDLAKAPHVLIAGPTGQGKSVLINVILASLLFKKHPAEMKLVLMEPSGLELGPYSCIQKHFLASLPDEPVVVSDSSQAVTTLNGLCKEMDRRFDLLRNAHTPNIKEYNRKIINRQLIPSRGYKYMPYIVVVIDEYGFFMEEKGAEIEKPITRLAKYARAAGIHMILSTRRLTKDAITDSIKENIPTRIAFKMLDRKCSRLILDRDGAEQLLGDGDLIYTNGDSPIRIQGAFVDTVEVDVINDYISSQKGYQRPYELPFT